MPWYTRCAHNLHANHQIEYRYVLYCTTHTHRHTHKPVKQWSEIECVNLCFSICFVFICDVSSVMWLDAWFWMPSYQMWTVWSVPVGRSIDPKRTRGGQFVKRGDDRCQHFVWVLLPQATVGGRVCSMHACWHPPKRSHSTLLYPIVIAYYRNEMKGWDVSTDHVYARPADMQSFSLLPVSRKLKRTTS